MGVHRTCGEPDEIKQNTHPKNITALFSEQAHLVGRFAYGLASTKDDPGVAEKWQAQVAVGCSVASGPGGDWQAYYSTATQASALLRAV